MYSNPFAPRNIRTCLHKMTSLFSDILLKVIAVLINSRIRDGIRSRAPLAYFLSWGPFICLIHNDRLHRFYPSCLPLMNRTLSTMILQTSIFYYILYFFYTRCLRFGWDIVSKNQGNIRIQVRGHPKIT